MNLLELLKRPDFNHHDISKLPNIGIEEIDPKVAEQVEVQAKYSGYIKRQEEEVERNHRHEGTVIPEDIDYAKVRGLSTEVIEKLSKYRPVNLGQASRIQGITPAAISLLRIHLKKQSLLFQQSA
jgi:tRNA uridine 5-carboxymethylaminomethyl modification enzyme